MNKYLTTFLGSLALAAAAAIGHVLGPDTPQPKHAHTKVTHGCETCFNIFVNFVGESHPKSVADAAPVQSETQGPPAPKEKPSE